ncbi:hypothetical protein RF11_04075 [Thelohanellus kitauei]|uniref:Uncharacterized protein n=1 Tax=Thelohanellus kitauei TaxID=669202 RepID=A0A0C2N6D5_THEKT|nr:hypothetical protein RF11_04075 [Thelohanellus kitauei]
MYPGDRPYIRGNVRNINYGMFKEYFEDKKNESQFYHRFCRFKYNYFHYCLHEYKDMDSFSVAMEATYRPWMLFTNCYFLYRATTDHKNLPAFCSYDLKHILTHTGRTSLIFGASLFLYALVFRLHRKLRPNHFSSYIIAGIVSAIPSALYHRSPLVFLFRGTMFAAFSAINAFDFIPSELRNKERYRSVGHNKKFKKPEILDI